MAKNEREHERDSAEGVTISDKRHSRDVDEELEEEAQAAVADEPSAAEVPAEAVSEEDARIAEQAPSTEPVGAPDLEGQPPVQEAERAVADSPEAAQLRMLFEAGIVGYLHGQLDLLLTFALIYLGRRPNPATGLVAADLGKAKLVIDLLDFIHANTQQELSEQDRAGLANLISGLKMEFAQAAREPSEGPAEGEGEA